MIFDEIIFQDFLNQLIDMKELIRKAADLLFRPASRQHSTLRRGLLIAATATLLPNSRQTFREQIPAASGRVEQPAVAKASPIEPNDKLAALAAFLPKDKDGKLDPANRADLEKFLKGKEWGKIEALLPSILKIFDHPLGEHVSHDYGKPAQRLAYVVTQCRMVAGKAVKEADMLQQRDMQILQKVTDLFLTKVQAAYDFHETDPRRTAEHHTVADVLKEVLRKPVSAISDAADYSRAIVNRQLAAHVAAVQKLVDLYPAFTRDTAQVIIDTCANSGVSVPVCLSTAAAESHLNPVNQNKSTGATGLAQYQEPDWYRAINWLDKTESGRAVLEKYPELRDLKQSLQLVGRDQYGQGNFEVVDRLVAKHASSKAKADKAKAEWARDLRLNPEINLAVWACQAETNMAVMAEILKQKPSSAEMWLANILGPSRAARFARFAKSNEKTHSGESGILSAPEVRLNPLFNATAGAVMARAQNEVDVAVRAAPVLAAQLTLVPEEARPDPRQVARPTVTAKRVGQAATHTRS